MLAAYDVGRDGPAKTGISIAPSALWWQRAAGAAQALGLEGVVGNLLPLCEADFIAINPRATPLLARRTGQASNLDELLFALIVLGDDRAVAHTLVQGQVIDPMLHSARARTPSFTNHAAIGP
jgi:guanine deaminase